MNFREANDDLGLAAKKFKLCFVTAIWQRPEVFEMFAEGIKLLQDKFKYQIEIHCCVSGSEGKNSESLVLRYNKFHYIEYSNFRLGEKMQAAVSLAKKLKPDYCLMVGSDDLIGVNLMNKYFECMQRGIDFAGLLDCYFFDVRTKRGLYWGGYRKAHNIGQTAGIGRLISADLLNKVNWICFPPGFDKILDTGFEKQLKNISYSKVDINLKKENLFALDIKSSTNMTPFAQWDNAFFIDGKEMLFENLPEPLAKLIYG